jgi:hypothetical protein
MRMHRFSTVIAALLLSACSAGRPAESAVEAAAPNAAEAPAGEAAGYPIPAAAVEAPEAGLAEEMAEIEAGAGAPDAAAAAPTDDGTQPSGGARDPQENPKAIAASAPSIRCREVRKRTTAEQCEDYRQQIADLGAGVAAFDPPRNMVKGVPVEVRLAIGPETDRTAVVRGAGGDADAVIAPIAVGARMRARLIGRAFTIDPAEPVDLEMGRARRQVWNWDVTPLREGQHPLSAEITVLADDGTVLDRYPSELVQVEVSVSETEAQRREREKQLEDRQRTEEDLGFYTRFLGILGDFWWALVLFVGGVIGGIFYLRNRWRNQDAGRPIEVPTTPKPKRDGSGDPEG